MKASSGNRENPARERSPQDLLSVEAITMQFGGLKAVDQLSFNVHKGELLGLIGPNGAGKTTVFNMLTGVYHPTEGQIYFNSELISGMKPYLISRKGLTRTFQNIRLFKDLTVLENVMIASAQKLTYGLLSSVFQLPKYFLQEKMISDSALKLLSIFGLEDKSSLIASSLSYGDQRKLEIVRTLATNPKMICLDEPAAGMNHQETHDLMNTISKIRNEFSLTVLLIEHDMKLVMGICERIIVLDHGVKIEEGSPEIIKRSPKVIEAYLGVEDSGGNNEK